MENSTRNRIQKSSFLRWASNLTFVCALVLAFTAGFNNVVNAQSGNTNVVATKQLRANGQQVQFAVAGNMPRNAEVRAAAVQRSTVAGKQAIAAYDISVYSGHSKWQPNAGQPVQVTITNPAFVDGAQLSVYHEGTNGLEFVADVIPSNGSITFPAASFSVYIVGGPEANEQRLKVNFHKADGSVTTIYVKPVDVTSGHYNTVLYDPGTGTLPANTTFRGWIQDVENYTAANVSQAKDIDGVRAIVQQRLQSPVSEGDHVDFYAMYFKSFLVIYLDENNATLGSQEILIPGSDPATSVSYTVNMAYVPQDNNHAFLGWQANTGGSNISGWTEGTTYENGTTITISGDVVFGVNSPEGHWLVFDENGKGGKYNAPQFLRTGQVTQRPVADSEMTRFGYTFGGWYTNAACTDGNEFTFGNQITDNTTIYAKWIPNATAPYTVIIWKQNITGDGYDFEQSISLSGTVGQNIGTVSQQSSGNNAYAQINGTNYTYTGFHLKEFDQNVEIKTEGNAVLNVYYDRTEYTLHFQDYGYSYTETTSTTGTQYGLVDGNYVQLTHQTTGQDIWTYSISQTAYTGTRYTYNNGWQSTTSNNGTQYGLVNGAYVRITRSGGTWYYSTLPYTGTRYTRSSSQSYHDVKTITALYGQSVLDQFPITGYENGVWRAQNSSTYGTLMLIFVDAMPAENVTFRLESAYSGNAFNMQFWVQPTSLSTNHNDYELLHSSNAYTTSIHLTYNEDFVELVGFNRESSDPAFVDGEIDHSGSGTMTVKFYYTRKVYPITYFDGKYVDGNNNTLSEIDHGQLYQVNGIAYQSDVSSYNKDNANYYIPTAQNDGFVFEGWFLDKDCTTPYTFDKMPEGGIKVYAKWRQIQYRVFLHPNAGSRDTDPSLFWGRDDQSMNFRISYGGKVSAPYGTRNNYEFVGWYSDAACTNAFNADAFIFNETNVTAAYDKTTDFTDPMDIWGNGATWNSDSMINATTLRDPERFWITKKFDIYAKWRATVDGATGINVVYDVTGGSPQPHDTRYYQDNVSANAGAAPTSSDPNKVFLHWQVQRWNGSAYEDVPGETVLPGAQFTVLKSLAKPVVTKWQNPANTGDILTITDPTPGTTPPDETYTRIYEATYTMQLKAVYIPIEEPAPTHITWYKHNGTETIVRQDGPDGLDINEAVNIPTLTEVGTYTGHTFLGWYRGNETTAAAVSATATPNFLWYNATDGKYYQESTFENVATQVAADERLPYHNLFAAWRLNTYKVHFNANGNGTDVTGTMNDQNFTYDEAQNLTANAFVRNGYCFQGWSETATGTVDFDNQESVINLTDVDGAVVNLYAVWQEQLTPDFNLADSYCYGETVNLSNTSPNGVTGTWKCDGGTVTSVNTTPTTAPVTKTYTFTPTEGQCAVPYSKQITVNPRANADITASKTAVCEGESATLSVAAAASYSWSTGATTQSIDVTPELSASPVNYKVTVTAEGGCQTVGSVDITVYANPTLSIVVTDEKCLKEGDIKVTVTNNTVSTPDYEFYLDGVLKKTEEINNYYTYENLVANHNASSYAASGKTYTVKVVDGHGCSATETAEVKLHPSDLTVSGVNVSICSGYQFSFKPSATSNQVMYTWDAPQLTCLTGGSGSTVEKPEITDVLTLQDGCSTGSAVYTIHPRLGVCKLNDVTVQVGASVSVRPPVSLAFTNPGTVCGNSTNDLSVTVTNAVAGSELRWTFTYGEETPQTYSVNTTGDASQTFSHNFTMPDICDGTASLHVDYLDNVAPGDACNASGSQAITIGVPTWDVPAAGASTVTCASAAVKPTASNITDGCGNTIVPEYVGVTPTDYATSIICTGTVKHTFRYKDCAGTEKDWIYTYTVTGPAAPTISRATGTEASYDYRCNPDQSDFTTLTAANFVVVDACNAAAEATVTRGDVNISTTSCDRSQIWTATYKNACNVSAQPVTVTYNWKATTQPTISTDLTGLIEKDCNWDGTTGAPAASDFTVTTGDLCATSSAASVSYAEPVLEGCYKTQVWTASYTNTCNQSASKQVTVKWKYDVTAPTIDAIADQNAVAAQNCKYKIPDLSGVTMAKVNDGCSTPEFVSQSPAVDELYAQQEAEYKVPVTVTVKDACGNTANKTVQVIIPAKLSVAATANPASICIGSSSTLKATPSNNSGTVTYSWTPSTTITGSGAEVTATPTTTTTYTVSATDANGCSATKDVEVSVSNELTLSATPLEQTICYQGAITPIQITTDATLTTSGLPTGVTLSGNTISGTCTANPGTYNYTITASSTTSACPAKEVSGKIVVPAELTVSVTPQNATCANNDGSATVTASGGTSPYTYSYAYKNTTHTGIDLSTKTTATPSGLDTAKYVVTVTDVNGCTTTAEFEVSLTNDLDVSVSGAPTDICSGGSFVVTPTSNAAGTTYYEWGLPTQSVDGAIQNTSASGTNETFIHGENLVNTTTSSVTLTYTVTPRYGVCVGTPSSIQVTVAVNTHPVPTITLADVTVCPNVGTKELTATFANVDNTNTVVTWKFNGAEVNHSGEVTPTNLTDSYTATIPNTPCSKTYPYTVSYSDGYGCVNTKGANVIVKLEDNITITGGTNEKTVECVAAAQVKPHELTPSVMPTVKDACNQDISSEYTLTTTPTAVECEGDMAYVYTYTDCDNHTETWTFTYHVDRTTAPAQVGTAVATTAEVECLAAAVAPTTLPLVKDVCGKTLDAPTPTVTDNIANCAGTRKYTYLYKDCANLEYEWVFTYTINPTTPPVVNATGIEAAKTVECLAAATAPTTIPTAKSKCDENLTGVLSSTSPVDNITNCEGTRTYTYIYTDCAGKTATWDYVYTITKKDFTMPSNQESQVACIAQATQPTPPTVTDNCGDALTVTGPTVGGTYSDCEGTRTYTWNYKDCSGKFSHDWVYTYTIEREDFTAPAADGKEVDCIADAVAPHTVTPNIMPTVTDNCGNPLSPVTLPTTYTVPAEGGYDGCSGKVIYTYTYEDCEGNSHDWVYTYTVKTPAVPTLSGTWPSNQTGVNACYAGRPDFPTNATIQGLYSAACGKTIQTVTSEDKNITSDDCGWSITREYTITDGCGSVTNSITYSGSDQTNPVIATGYATEVPAVVTNCEFSYPDLREIIRAKASDNCTTDPDQLTITQSPAQGTAITPSATAQTLPVVITVADKCGKTATATINVTVPATMEVSVTDYASLCYGQDDGYIKFNIVGGEPNYVATLTGNTTATETYTTAGAKTIDHLADGAYTLKVKDANGCEATAPATITIEQIQNTLTITANSNSWTYDGNAHTDPGFTVKFGDEEVTGTSGSSVTMANGDVISGVTITGTITNVTESPVANVVGTGYTITRGTDDVTCFYNIQPKNGQLTIMNSGALSLTCEDKSKEYDGTALSYTAVPSVTDGTTVSYSTDGGTTWSTTAPSITNVSESPLTVNVKAENNNYTTATCSYVLTITKKPLTINVTDTKTYDGSVLVSGLSKATATGLVTGDALTAGEVTTSSKNVGSYTYSSTASITQAFATTKGIGNYEVTYTTSQTIEKATLTLVSDNLSKQYDGIALVNGTTPLATESGWITGEGATYTFTGSQLDKGSSANSFDIVPNSNTDLNNYQISKTEGTLTVTQNTTTITLTANSDQKVYDGTALTNNGYTYNTSLLAATDTIVAVVVGTRTDVGTAPNVITEYHAYRGMKSRGTKDVVDVTDNYTITPVNGTLEVTKQTVTITAATANYPYDGAVHSNPNASIVGLIGTDAITPVITGSIQFPSQSPVTNEVTSYSFTSGDPDNYEVVTVDGQLTMSCTPVTLAITADDYNEKYDGDTHTKNSYKLVVNGGTPINVTGSTYTFTNTGDVLTVNISGNITHAAESDVTNEITSYTIMHGTTNMVDEGCYTVTTTNGKLTVTCRNITLTSGDASKTYDGNPLSNETVDVTGDGFVTGEGATYSNFNSITNVSQTAANNNTFDYTFNTGTTATDYCVTPVYGTLTITPLENVEVVITEHSAEYDYDGTAKTVTGYDVTSISSTLYHESDFSFVGPDAHKTVTETAVGTYPMGIVPDDFQNNNTNFSNVKFTIVDGQLVIYPQMIISATYDVVPVTCYGDGDGYVTIPVSGGKPGNPQYTYSVTGPATYSGSTNSPLVLTGLNKGTYNVTVTDALGSEATTSFTINEPDPLVATLTVPASACPNQATYPVSVAVTGGNSGYTYAWSEDAANVDAASTTVAMAGTNDCGHEYTVKVDVTDAKNCTATDTKKFTVVDNEKPDFTVPADITICRATDGTFDAGVTVTGEPDPTTYSDNCTAAADLVMTYVNKDTVPASNLATRVLTREWTLTDLCGNATTKAQKITINPTVVMDTPTDQVICHNTAIMEVEFTTTVTDGSMTYAWTATNTSDNSGNIGGLSASGTGNISALTLTNTTTEAQTTTITVTPTYTNNGEDCVGAPVTFTITVYPKVVMNTPDNQVVCHNTAMTAVTFGTTLTDGSMSYAWTSSNANVGGLTPGTGNMPAATLTNTTTQTQTTTISVTPTYTNNGISCVGDPVTFTITVNPKVVMETPGNQTICHNSAITAINFTTSITDGSMSYAWTSDNTNIGNLPASGTGNIGALTLTNTTTTAQTANIQVTPTYTNNGISCVGDPVTFTITVNPKVVMNTPDNQTICDREEIAPVNFTTTITDGSMTYNWTSSNTTTITGLTSPGTGNIPATALTNTEATVQTTTITVTPTYTNGGVSCDGDPVTFTITVKPSATGMENLTAYIKCNGDAFTATPTATSTGKIPAGTQYTWTVTPNTNVTGYSDQTTPVDAPISQNLTNTSNTLQTVVYNVTPVTDGCNGETFTISVDVEPTPVLTLNCPADVNKELNFGECEVEVTPSELGTPTWTHSLGWTAITITNNAPADNMYPEGDNIVTWTMEDECGNTATCQQHVIVTFPVCPDATDKDGNVYHSVHIDCDCWTVRNLESLTYPDYATNHTTAHDNAGAAIPGVYNYTSAEYPNTTQNVENFGRLYDWPSVINGGQLNDYGHVQGICPDGWYLPTAEKYAALDTHGADALKDSRFWLDGGGSNTTGFSSLPGGYYDGSIQRYLNLMGEAYYWSTTMEGGAVAPAAFGMSYNCDFLINESTREGLGYSVRCVKERE